jgi:hypothetical protein
MNNSAAKGRREHSPPECRLQIQGGSLGTIKLFDKERSCGCVQDDRDGRIYFFHRGCIAPNYLPRKGDRVALTVRANPRSGGLEAYNLEPLAAASGVTVAKNAVTQALAFGRADTAEWRRKLVISSGGLCFPFKPRVAIRL